MDLNFNIFISHDSQDEAVALELRVFIENIFLNSSVYVSGRDLEGGQTWIENIKLSLKTSQVIISLVTKKSIDNNWIYFETGAGFTEDKSIPLLADNLKFNDLRPPLSLLQSRTLTRAGIEALVADISSKLNLRVPKILMGIDKLLEESEKFFALRNSETAQIVNKTTQATTPVQKANKIRSSSTGKDPELLVEYDKTVARAKKLIKQKILSFKDKLDIPSEEELDELNLTRIQDAARTYNIPTPTSAVLNLVIANLNFPKVDSQKWEKLNTNKAITNANSELDKYEKNI